MSLLRQFLLQGPAGDLAEVVAPSNASGLAGWATKGLRVLLGRTDRVANLPVLLDYDQHQVHQGAAWRWSTYVPELGNGQSRDVRLVVPNITIPSGNSAVGLCPHLRFEVVSSGDALAFLHEGSTFSDGGTVRTPVAMERNGTYAPKLALYESPTVSALGTLLWQGLLLSAAPRAGSADGSAAEFVLKNNTVYAFRVTSMGAINKVLIRLVWYEDLGG